MKLKKKKFSLYNMQIVEEITELCLVLGFHRQSASYCYDTT